MQSGPQAVSIDVAGVMLQGQIRPAEASRGLLLFVHGSGSSRFSPRNRHVADVLHRAGISTLLFDLLSSSEEAEDALTGALRFDVGRLASRLVQVTRWVRDGRPEARQALGYFGASTGAAAALLASCDAGPVAAIVSRGGRPGSGRSFSGAGRGADAAHRRRRGSRRARAQPRGTTAAALSVATYGRAWRHAPVSRAGRTGHRGATGRRWVPRALRPRHTAGLSRRRRAD
jgi:hypothetical protein